MSSGPSRPITYSGVKLRRSASIQTITSPVLAATLAHNTLPLPVAVPASGSTSGTETTRAPAAAATWAVASVLRSSITTISSTRPQCRRVAIVCTIGPTVSASSRAGTHTETVAVAFSSQRRVRSNSLASKRRGRSRATRSTASMGGRVRSVTIGLRPGLVQPMRIPRRSRRSLPGACSPSATFGVQRSKVR